MADTPNHEYNVPDQGDQDWHNPLNENFEAFDSDIELRDEESELSTYTPAAGAKFLSTDTGVVYVGDGSDWTAAFVHPAYDPSTGEAQFNQTVSTPGLTGALTGGDELTDIAGNNLTISNGQLDASTGGGGGGGGGISSLSGGDGVDPASISDGDTLSVAWGDANDLDSDGNVTGGGGGGSEWQQNGSLLEPSDATIEGIDVARVQTVTLQGLVTGGQELSTIAGTNLSIDSNGQLNASTGGGGGGNWTVNNSLLEPSDSSIDGVDVDEVNTDALLGTLTGGQEISDIAGNNLSIDSNGQLNASGGGGGISSLSGGDGVDPASISDGDTLSVAWGDANDLDSDGNVTTGGGGGGEWQQNGSLLEPSDSSIDGVDVDELHAPLLDAGAGPLEVTVGGARVLRVTAEDSGDAGNVVAGHSSNEVISGVIGATIAGGGLHGGGNLQPNSVTGEYGTVGGGFGNRADESGTVGGGSANRASNLGATVAGGRNNLAAGQASSVGGGESNDADGDDATVAGGKENTAGFTRTTVGGGFDNTADGEGATIAGGTSNVASGFNASIGGGGSSEVTADYATIGGGRHNNAAGEYATIAGGGPTDTSNPDTTNNVVYDEYGTIGGGGGNQAGTDDGDPTTAVGATVSGGKDNKAFGLFTTVSGGDGNEASAGLATVGGGTNNEASMTAATVSGGEGNEASAGAATVGGGVNNEASKTAATVSGGGRNEASVRATVGGGRDNRARGQSATIGGGRDNDAFAKYATIAGGGPSDDGNRASTRNAVYDEYGTIGGGGNNQAGSDDSDPGTARYATVSGGEGNEASAGAATVGGGVNNEASKTAATVGGGTNNEASDQAATVGGGAENEASVTSATVAGGIINKARGEGATIGGGKSNEVTAEYATVLGGEDNTASAAHAVAAGRNATASNPGSLVVGDSTSNSVESVEDNQARFQGSIRSGRLTTESDGIWHYSDSQSTTADWRTVYAPGNDEWRVEQWDPDSGLGAWFRKMWVTAGGDVEAQGAKNFVETVDTDDGEKEVVYTASESGTAHTEESGVAELDDGRVEIDLPEHFAWVTSEDDPLHVQTTPYSADSAGLAVVERSTEHLVVEDLDGEGDYEFSYTVRGTRDGYEDKQVVREPSEATANESASPADD
jgi:hypothetical protein